MRLFLSVLFGLLGAHSLLAQAPVDTVFVLDEIHVQAAREFEVEQQAPFSLYMFERDPDAMTSNTGVTLQDVTAHIPGLWIADRGHLALGERIVLRGASARSPFGTRGIQILYDGIPLTAPDGQAITDIVDPAMIRSVEVIRGPTSTFWGNASAGTLFFSTEPVDQPLSIQTRAGNLGDYYVGVRGSVERDEWRSAAFLSHLRRDGYRTHADGFISRGGFRAQREVGETGLLRVVGAGAWQDVRSPGSLNQTEWEDDPTRANQAYINTNSGKESAHGQVGIFYRLGMDRALLEVGGYGIVREMINPLPFAFIDLSRSITGARLNFTQRIGRFEWSIGADAARQADGRRNFNNDNGEAGENLLLDQQEYVRSLGANIYMRYPIIERLFISAGVRGDHLRYSMDNLLAGADTEGRGERSFSALSPSAGLSLESRGIVYYASFASSYETPTTTELVNRPDMQPGFNPDLQPERTWSIEGGLRGPLSSMLSADVSLFWARIEDRMLPFRTQEGGDRTFFRNADVGHHRGAEAHLSLRASRWLRLLSAYSLLDATFVDAGGMTRDLPGVPQHQGYFEASYTPDWWRIWARLEVVSDFYADDANSVQIDGFEVVDVGVGHTNVTIGPATVLPFFRVNNVFDATYSRSVVVNASFGRYYEPSPGRSFELGVSLRY